MPATATAVSPPSARSRRLRAAIVLLLAIFALNAWICRELAALGASSAKIRSDHRWFPWFNVGRATQNAYQALLPAPASVTGAIAGWPSSLSPHARAGFCLLLRTCYAVLVRQGTVGIHRSRWEALLKF